MRDMTFRPTCICHLKIVTKCVSPVNVISLCSILPYNLYEQELLRDRKEVVLQQSSVGRGIFFLEPEKEDRLKKEKRQIGGREIRF